MKHHLARTNKNVSDGTSTPNEVGEIFVKSEKHKSKEANVLTKGLNKIIQKKTTKFERQKT